MYAIAERIPFAFRRRVAEEVYDSWYGGLRCNKLGQDPLGLALTAMGGTTDTPDCDEVGRIFDYREPGCYEQVRKQAMRFSDDWHDGRIINLPKALGVVLPSTRAALSDSVVRPAPSTPIHRLESLGLRPPLLHHRPSDDGPLVGLLTELRVIETHFALFSKPPVVGVASWQQSVRVNDSVVDARYYIRREHYDRRRYDSSSDLALVCVIEDLQVRTSPRTLWEYMLPVFHERDTRRSNVIPMMVLPQNDGTLYVAEFALVPWPSRTDVMLTLASDAVYQFVPPVPGIGA